MHEDPHPNAVLMLYGQWSYHMDARIIANKDGLIQLREAIDRALEAGKSTFMATPTDGECYDFNIEVVDAPFADLETWDKYAPEYIQVLGWEEYDKGYKKAMSEKKTSRQEQIERLLKILPGKPWHVFDGLTGETWSVCSQDGDCDEGCPQEPHCHVCVAHEILDKQTAEAIAWMRSFFD